MDHQMCYALFRGDAVSHSLVTTMPACPLYCHKNRENNNCRDEMRACAENLLGHVWSIVCGTLSLSLVRTESLASCEEGSERNVIL